LRAVVLERSPGLLRVVDDWPEPQVGSGQVIVRVRGVGICGSDLALIAGHRPPPSLPWVPGHETLGEIVETGPGVDSMRVGQRVIIEPNIPCLACPACRSGRTSACPSRISLGFNAPGTLTERIAVPARFAWPVPESCGDADAVCVEPLSVVRSAIRRAKLNAASRCLVIGAGSQGSLLCLAMAARGIIPHVLEPHAGRRALAAELGAQVNDPDASGFDVVFETSGTPAALTGAVSRAARGGQIVLIGMSDQPAPLVTRNVVQRQLTIQGSLVYDHPGDFAETLASVGRGLCPARVLRACHPLAEAAAAFRTARDVPGKTWIRLEG
jgi:2-desacetyl-2-hydroxyethyl bacteriochlorophyllide A dehydrogenase